MISGSSASGFTLVEISIVMIIVGLLIGGTFGGMKLIENMQVNKTVQDLKAIESAALTFRDTYGRLPGDMPNTAARLPNCTDAPCATGGNGNRIIGSANLGGNAIGNTDENFTFWHHLQAADLLSMDYSNSSDMSFSVGQPSAPIDSGFRVSDYSGTLGCTRFSKGLIFIADLPSAQLSVPRGVNCKAIESVDLKLDDGLPYHGRFLGGWGCSLTTTDCTAPPLYAPASANGGLGLYDAGF